LSLSSQQQENVQDRFSEHIVQIHAWVACLHGGIADTLRMELSAPLTARPAGFQIMLAIAALLGGDNLR
jgi:hypothetical protein